MGAAVRRGVRRGQARRERDVQISQTCLSPPRLRPVFKSLHILVYIDDDTYRRDIKGVRNLQEGRHSLAGHVFHGKKGELYQRYHKGMEDQLGALGLVLNCIVLWNTRYMNAALEQLRAEGREVRDEDVARLSPFVSNHLNVHGKFRRPARDRRTRHPARLADDPRRTPRNSNRLATAARR